VFVLLQRYTERKAASAGLHCNKVGQQHHSFDTESKIHVTK